MTTETAEKLMPESLMVVTLGRKEKVVMLIFFTVPVMIQISFGVESSCFKPRSNNVNCIACFRIVLFIHSVLFSRNLPVNKAFHTSAENLRWLH